MGLRGTSWAPRASVTVALLLCTLAVAPAYGQSPSTEAPASADKTRAADLFKKSADAYRQGDFKHAIELLDEAYALDPQPVLIYNRARAEEGLGNLGAAISGYERFLTEEPNAPDRGAIEQRLATLRRQRDERAALEKDRDARRESPASVAPAPAAPLPIAPPASEPTPRRHSVLPYAVAGVGLAGIAAGAIFGGLALSKNDDAAAEPVQQKSIDLKDSADGLATVSTTSFIVGGALLAVGTAWWLLDHRSSKKPGLDSVRIGPGFSLVGLGGTLP